MNEKKNICFVAGKSGGHIIPCLTLVQDYTEQINVLFFSSNTHLDQKILAQHPRISWHIMLPLSTKAGSLFKTIWHTLSSFLISFFYLYKYRPTHIITTGGIVAIPPCIAAYILRIPITLYSLDAIPGKAIKALTPLATTIITCFATSQKYFPAQKYSLGLYPLKYRNQLYQPMDQYLARINLQLSPEKKTILILGGSQGSVFLNQCIIKWAQNAKKIGLSFQIIHQTGPDNEEIKSFYSNNNIQAHVFSFISDLSSIYIAADLIISRAGAGTLFETQFFNKSCIVIPLMTNTTTHQVDNAHAIMAQYPELFHVIAQADIENNYSILFEKIDQLLHSPSIMQ